MKISRSTPALSGTVNDLKPDYGDIVFLRTMASGNAVVTGIVPDPTYPAIILRNASFSDTITLAANSSGSAAANRFHISSDIVLRSGDIYRFVYDPVIPGWLVVSNASANGGGGGGTTLAPGSGFAVGNYVPKRYIDNSLSQQDMADALCTLWDYFIKRNLFQAGPISPLNLEVYCKITPAFAYQDAAGTTPISADNQNVAFLLNAVEGNVNVSQTDNTKIPKTHVDGNGKYWVRTDGVSRFLQLTQPFAWEPCTITIALNFITRNNIGVAGFSFGVQRRLGYNPATGNFVFYRGAGDFLDLGLTAANPCVLTLRCEIGATHLPMLNGVNGSVPLSNVLLPGIGTGALAPFRIGADDFGDYCAIDVGGFAIHSTILDDTTAASVAATIGSDSGITF